MSGGVGSKEKAAVSDITDICYLHHKKPDFIGLFEFYFSFTQSVFAGRRVRFPPNTARDDDGLMFPK